ncbi:uncharacterized protein F5891DRAFT_982684 [Suillus fuscotomentosus]|uniref:Uncharacterized protein n=1 Tax=Suillus fuscotomentosus TaxID=1912939 RepID=A0AAD4E044_9AGAM|nr:uncharacterized protein F5891DRAFT_982684 [Suillus fuscotomentosus]KAG1897291.1 hypothetical protein F5891DRAFT_982684 [Suillus fuscotomentosus]
MSDHDSGSESESNKQPALNEDEVAILRSYIEQWDSAEVSDRNKVLKAAATEARTKAPVYETWFRNQGMKKKPAKPPIKMGQRWTERSVIDTLRKKELLKTIQDETGAKPGMKEMINHYTKQLNLLIASLSPEELKEAKETADIWNCQGVPDDVKSDIARKKSDDMIHHFATEMWNRAGMRVFVVSAWKNEEGKIHVPASHISGSHDYNNEYGGADSFMKTRKWDAILPEWDSYAESAFDGNLDGDAVATRKKGRQDKTYILDVGDDGYPVLPACDSMDLDTKKAVVRTFLTWHYRKCCGDPKISIPWKYVIPRCGEIIPTECLPEGHNLAEPSKLRQIHATELLQFWYNRQEEREERVLEFIGWWDNDKEDMVLAADMEVPVTTARKNKRKLKEMSDPPRKQARPRQQSPAGRSQSGINVKTKRARQEPETNIQHGTAASGRAQKNHKVKRPSNKESDDTQTISDESLAEQSNGSEDDIPSGQTAIVPKHLRGRPVLIRGSNDSDSEVEENICEKSVEPARGKKGAFPIQAAAIDMRSSKKGAAVEKPRDGPPKHVQKGPDPDRSASAVTRKAIAPRQRMADLPTEAGRSSRERKDAVVGAKARGQKRTAEECLEGSPAKRKRCQGVQQDKVASIEAKEKPRKKRVEEATNGSPSKRTRSKTSQLAAGKRSRKPNSRYNDYVKP